MAVDIQCTLVEDSFINKIEHSFTHNLDLPLNIGLVASSSSSTAGFNQKLTRQDDNVSGKTINFPLVVVSASSVALAFIFTLYRHEQRALFWWLPSRKINLASAAFN